MSESRIGMIGVIVGDIAGSRFKWHNHQDKQYGCC